MQQGLIVSGLNHLMHMRVDDLWKIENNKATLVDTSGKGIYIEFDGSIFLLSEFDFTNNMAAAESIVQYYSKDYALSAYHNGGDFELKGGYFSSYASAARVKLETTAMRVTLNRVDASITGRFYLIGGKFSPLLNNKSNMINTIGHEYKHYLDNLRFRTLSNYQFKNNNIQGFSRSFKELRAILYQRSLPSWIDTTPEFKQNILNYESKFL